MRTKGALITVLGVMTIAAGCSSQANDAAQGGVLADGEYSTESIKILPTTTGKLIKIDGSSTVFPISYEATQRYQRKNQQSPAFAVSFSGTGGGFDKFCAGETDINDASRPIRVEEMKACKENGIKYIELPVALDAITLVVNSENDWAKDLTVQELQKIWNPDAEGQIKNWNQVRSSWPDRPLNLYGPGEDSGTFDYFTKVIVGRSGDSRKDYTQSEDDSLLVDKISTDPNGLGYFGLGYYAANWNRLKSLAIDNTQPTVEAVKNLEYQPLSRPLFVYVNAETIQQKPELQKFMEFYIKDVRNWVPFVGYVPLEKDEYQLVSERLKKRTIGTVYGGELETKVEIGEMLKRESKS